MLLEINTKTSETEKGYYKGEVTLVTQGEGAQRQSFAFTLSDVGTDKQQLIVRRKEHIFINAEGQMQEGNQSLHNLTESQVTLLKLMGRGVSSTLQQIAAERGGSQGAADEAAKLWGQLGMSFEIVAEDKYTVEIKEPVEQSYVMQLFENDQ